MVSRLHITALAVVEINYIYFGYGLFRSVYSVYSDEVERVREMIWSCDRERLLLDYTPLNLTANLIYLTANFCECHVIYHLFIYPLYDNTMLYTAICLSIFILSTVLYMYFLLFYLNPVLFLVLLYFQ